MRARTSWITFLVVAAVPHVFAGAGEPTRPNIIFILVDALRADRLRCYGQSRGFETPTMDSLARDGVLLEHVVAAAPWTFPSVSSVLTGVYPSVHKAVDAGNTVQKLPEQFITLTEALHASGYLTAGFSANPLVCQKNGLAQGFDHFDSSFAANTAPGSRVTDTALRWLRTRDESKPLFLYLHYMDVHAPYVADARHIDPLIARVKAMPNKRRVNSNQFGKPPLSREYRARLDHQPLVPYVEYWEACYDAGVPKVDESLRDLRRALLALHLWDDAWVILVSDHGEALGEHEILGRDGRFHEVWGHGDSVYESELHVPLIMRWRDGLPAGQRILNTLSLIDLMPTMLDLLKIDEPPEVQGRSFAGLLRGEPLSNLLIMAEGVKKRPDVQALYSGPWKVVAYGARNRWELFELITDPAEQTDVASVAGATIEELKGLLSGQASRNNLLAKGVTTGTATISAAELERLQALGYFLGSNDDEAVPSAAPATQSSPD